MVSIKLGYPITTQGGYPFMKLVICSDDSHFHDILVQALNEQAFLFNMKIEVTSYDSLLELADDYRLSCDLFVLCPDNSSSDFIGLCKIIRQGNPAGIIVIIAQDSRYALDGYALRVQRYYFHDDVVADPVGFAAGLINIYRKVHRVLPFDFEMSAVHIEAGKVEYVESIRKELLFVTCEGGRFFLQSKLDDVREVLVDNGFLLVHSSIMVNPEHIDRVRNRTVYFKSGREVPVAKKMLRVFLNKLEMM